MGVAVAGSLLQAAGNLCANPLGMPIGCQLYPVGKLIAQDFEGTLKQLSAIGYQIVELCSPPTYEKSGFAPLVKMTAAEVRKAFKDAGLGCESCHYGFKELKENLDDRIAYAKELGLKYMILASFGLKPDATLDDWARAAGELNKIGEQTRKAGIQLGFHNHHFEFKEIGGVLVYDKLMSEFDPKLVKMQFQVAVISRDEHDVTGCHGRFHHPAQVLIDDFGTFDLGFIIRGMPDHITIGKIGDDQVITLADTIDHLVGYLVEAQTGHLVEWNSLG